ncbi:MAG: 3-phosphoshikimate 1-carboxyvinyltransferase [Ignavibacteriaceae bacterium]|nr:3-phosphoshikimate 1-carboxyvinyltransferase [Ignavibacteriaceae bacterium]
MTEKFNKVLQVSGELTFDGDKSVSHRALIFSAMAEGDSIIRNINRGLDVNSTMNCLRELGVRIEDKNDFLIVHGKGLKGFERPERMLDAGNSGTTARLLSGLLSVQNFKSEITGDESLCRRPMKRVCDPLREMGANIKSNDGFLPLTFFPSNELSAIRYQLTIPSAQVKTAIILAALHLDEDTTIKETAGSRNHTENMLGLPVNPSPDGNIILINSSFYPSPREYDIPGDISSASFFIVLCLLVPDSHLVLKSVLLNSQRLAFIKHLQNMGADITMLKDDGTSGELTGSIEVKYSQLRNVPFVNEMIPSLIDELPILTIAGLFAEGDFCLTNANELRVKESDRIESMVANIRLMGINVDVYEDGYKFPGNNTPTGGLLFDSYGDHRIAMSLIILALLLKDGAKINNLSAVKISNPNFFDQLKKITR